MKKITLLFSIFLLSQISSFAQGTCAGAAPFCTASGTTFPASTGTTAPAGPNYGCLGSEPNPAWYYLQISTAGNININLSNSANVDIDFAAWGPFASQSAMCAGTSNSPFDCSYSTASTEQVNIVGASVGQWYMVMITNFANVPTNISATTAGGSSGATNCAILCNMTGLTAVPGATACPAGTYTLSGTITTTTPPSTGTLTITNSCGGSQVLNPPFSTSTPYSFPGMTATGGGCSVTATYSADPTCTLTTPYTSPAPCSSCTATASNTGPYCAGATIQLNSTPGAATSYSWTGPGGYTSTAQNPTRPASTTAMSGVYTVTVTVGGSTCTASTTVTVNAAPVTTVNSPTICNGATATLTAGGATTYAWSTGSGANPINVSPSTTTTYTVTGTTAGCTSTAVSTVTVNPIPVTTVNSPTICPGGTATLTAGGATTYVWSDGSITNPINVTPGATSTYTVTGTSLGCTSTAVATVTIGAAITPTVNSPTICFGGTATLTATGGTTYAWSNGSVTNPTTVTPAATISYTVTATASGCTGTAVATVTVAPQLTLAVAGIPATCNGTCDGQTIVIPSGGTTPYSYLWSSGCIAASCNSLCAGPYSLTVTDGMGCTATGNATVTEPTAIVLVMSGVTAHCNLPDGSATVAASGGTPGYTYLWNDPLGQTTPTAVNLTPGNYCVTVTDANGCTANSCFVVPNASGVVASITAQTPASCNGVCDATATAAGAGGVAPYTYAWNSIPVQTTITATALCAGTYIVTVTDASGCSDTASVIITEPTLVVTAAMSNMTICNAGSATLTPSASGGNGAPYTYTWTAPAGTPVGSPITVTPPATTLYTVVATDGAGCPAAPVSVTVTVNPPLSVVASGTTSVCPGTSATISAAAANGNGGPYTYTWMPGSLSGSSVSVTPGTTTTYTVTANDGCSPATTDSVIVTVLPVPVVIINSNVTSGCAPLCVNFSDNSTVSGGDTVNVWSWAFSDGGTSNIENPTHCFNNAGSYSVSLTVTSSAGGCTSSMTNTNMITVFPIPTADFTAPLSTSILNPTVPFTDNSLGANAWAWSFNDALNPAGDTSNLQSPSYTFSEVGTYCVELWITSANGCIDSTTMCVVIDPEFTFFIPNAFSPNGDGVNDEFYGKGDFIDKFEMYIYDRWGNMIFFADDINKHWTGTANYGRDLAQQDTYVYVVKLTDNKSRKHKYIGSVTLVK